MAETMDCGQHVWCLKKQEGPFATSVCDVWWKLLWSRRQHRDEIPSSSTHHKEMQEAGGGSGKGEKVPHGEFRF